MPAGPQREYIYGRFCGTFHRSFGDLRRILMATQMNPAALAGLTGVARRLVVEGTLADADARKAVEASVKQKIPLGTYLIEHALANGAQVAMASSAEFGVPLFDAEALDLAQAPIK